ncbi:MAG: antibiotic biosynthesis monooxygenase [Acidobacteria bacterium]|nr:antibiotic biosynthesis monooxygenase [Acidobacteriota bacterium]
MLNRKSLALSFIALMLLAFSALAQDPAPIYPENYKVLIENDRVRVMNFKLRKGTKEDFHAHPAHVVYVLTGFKIMFRFPDGRTALRETKTGDVLFSEAVTHASENIGDTDAHGLLVELKSTPPGNGSPEELLTAITFITGLQGKEDELKRELLALSAPTRAEASNLKYDLYQSTVKPNRFMRLEVWRNPQALEDHKATPHIKASFKKRQEQGWMTEITTWKRVSEDLQPAGQAKKD